jgi:hypothetical protein
MRLQRFASSWRIKLLVTLALVHDAGCGGRPRSELHCNTDPVVIDGKATGLASCEEAVVHRAEKMACDNPFPRNVPACVSTSPASDACHTDADCTEFAHGFCSPNGDNSFCSCDYGCLSDDDCFPAGQVCVCGDPVGSCSGATCTADADCKSKLCTAPHYPSDVIGDFACVSPEDECEVDTDCSSISCFYDDSLGARRCGSASSGCSFGGSGRPFLVEGAARVAGLAARDDWQAIAAPPRLDGLSAPEREAIAAGWARAGLLEHASIAAFARFTLQLLSLGAPADLVRDAQAAMADEIEHARVCFAIAGAHGGRAVGPGPLDLGGALAGGSAREILVTAILEGCVGETVAALEAFELNQRAVDPAVRRALETIAADEARHAELAWRFVRWAIDRDPSLASAAESAFGAAAAVPAETEEAGPDLSAHGLASAPQRREIARQARALVIGPCAAALSRSTRRPGGDAYFALERMVSTGHAA